MAGGGGGRWLATEEREWRGWLESGRFPETDGVPVPTALALCRRVAAWARGRAAPRPGSRENDRDEMLDAVADQAETAAAVVAACGSPRLPRPQLDRMLDMVLTDGVTMPAGRAEAAPWATVDDPGQLWGPAGTVLWWGFVEPAAVTPSVPWSKTERSAPARAGCLPEPAGASLAREQVEAVRLLYVGLTREWRLGERLPTPGGADITRLGEAMHGFLAVDRPETPAARRLALAAGLLARWEVPVRAAWPATDLRPDRPAGRNGRRLGDRRSQGLSRPARALGPSAPWSTRPNGRSTPGWWRKPVAARCWDAFIHMPVVGRLLEVGLPAIRA